jgi:hypothetical protein
VKYKDPAHYSAKEAELVRLFAGRGIELRIVDAGPGTRILIINLITANSHNTAPTSPSKGFRSPS